MHDRLGGADGDSYDLLGRMTGASYTGHALTFTFDALGRNLTQVSPLGTVSYQYDLAGRRTRLTYPGSGLYVDYDYLVTGDVLKIRENGATSGVGVLATYAYDDLGRRTSLTRGNGTVTTYGFDTTSRLDELVQNLAGTTSDLTLTFGHNPASQIVSNTRSNDSFAFTGLANQNVTDTINGLNQVTATGGTSVSHDSRGNVSVIGSSSYGYSSENLLTSAPGSVTLAYGPLLRLYQTVGASTTRFLYDGVSMIAEYDASNVLQRRFVHGPGIDEPIAWYEGTGTTTRRWFHADERGSVVAVSDSSGNLHGTRNRYDEYGNVQGTLTGRFGYTGQAWIFEAGLWYYRARMYNAVLGRFMQTDPIGYGGGMNLYAYVGNDPMNLTDPLGLGECPPTPDPDDIEVCGHPLIPRSHSGGGGGAGLGGGTGCAQRRTMTGLQANACIVQAELRNEQQRQQESDACRELREASERTADDLPGYVVTNENIWNNPAILEAYGNLYQDNANELSYIDNLAVVSVAGLAFAFTPGGVVLKGLAAVTSGGLLFDASSRRQRNEAHVREIEARQAYLRACGGRNSGN